MRVMTRTILAVSALAATVAAQPASAAPYAVMTGVKGVVTLYDLSSVTPTPAGFQIWHVAVANQWPTVFGTISYRVAREDFDCRAGRYDATVVRDYDRDGKLLIELHDRGRGEMERVSATVASEMFNRFCPAASGAPHLAGLDPREVVEEDTPQAAAEYGLTVLGGMR